jgi:membrane protein DedA with SNARE-associated domain
MPRLRTVLLMAALFSGHTLHDLLGNYGYAAVFLFVGIESLGIPFPGETMVIVAATYAGATHHLTIWLIWLAAAAGAIIGDNIGFGIGHWGGYRLIRRYGHKVRLNEAKIKVGRLIFDRHGGKVVFFGRFVSVLRTYAAFLAGTTRMPYLRFLFFNASGGIVWSGIYAIGFYYLGSALEHVRGPVDYGLGGVAVVAVILFVLWLRRNEKRLEAEAERVYPGPLEEYEAGERTGGGGGGAADGDGAAGGSAADGARLDDGQQDQQADDDQHQGGQGVAPALEPLGSDLVAGPGGGQGEADDRPDGDAGEDDQRPDGHADTHSGGGQEHGKDREVRGGGGPEGDHHRGQAPEP